MPPDTAWLHTAPDRPLRRHRVPCINMPLDPESLPRMQVVRVRAVTPLFPGRSCVRKRRQTRNRTTGMVVAATGIEDTGARQMVGTHCLWREDLAPGAAGVHRCVELEGLPDDFWPGSTDRTVDCCRPDDRCPSTTPVLLAVSDNGTASALLGSPSPMGIAPGKWWINDGWPEPGRSSPRAGPRCCVAAAAAWTPRP